MNVPEYLASSNEFQPVDITVDRVPLAVATSVDLGTSQDPNAVAPAQWEPAVTLAGRIGLMTGGRLPGFHYVFFRYSSSAEQIVRRAELPGAFYIQG